MTHDDNKEKKRRVMARVAAVQESLRRWDPIGICPGADGPLDEYDSYAFGLVSIVDRGGSLEELRRALEHIATETIGMPSAPGRDLTCAREIVAALRDLPS